MLSLLKFKNMEEMGFTPSMGLIYLLHDKWGDDAL